MRAQKLIGSRYVRVAVAAVLILVGAWAFLPYATHRVATSAFINSELIRVTAPIAGRLVDSIPHKGTYFDRATSMILVNAVSSDRRHLFDLERQHALARENGGLARRQLREIMELDAELAARIDTYRRGVVEKLAREVAEVEAEKAGCLAELRQRTQVGSRMEALTRSGWASEIRSAEALATQEAASTRCAVAQARLERVKSEHRSAMGGVLVREGANDVPYSQQQRERLVLRRQELETLILQEAARATQLEEAIAAERERLQLLDSYRVSIPAFHVVWSTAASPGSAVTEGQTLLDLADCRKQFVVVELPERDFEAIKVGDAAAVRLVGGSDWQQGRVLQVRGSAGRSDDRLFAAHVPSANPGTITVEVALPSNDALAGGRNFCGIGRLAEVRFRRGSFGIVAALASGMSWLTGRSQAQTMRAAAAGN